MKTKILIILIFLSTIACCETITKESFINSLKNNHPIFKKEYLSVEIEKQTQNIFKSITDWNISSTLTSSYKEDDLVSSEFEKYKGANLGVSIDKTFWESGGTLSIEVNSNYTDIEVINKMDFYKQQFGLSYSHPLSKNKNGFLTQLSFNLQQFAIDSAKISVIENLENFLLRNIQKYHEWVYFYEEKKILESRLNLSEDLLNEIKKKRETNLVDYVDVIRAEDSLRLVKQTLMLSKTSFKAIGQELSILAKKQLIEMNPKYSLYEKVAYKSIQDAVLYYRNNSRLIKLIDKQIERQNFNLRSIKEEKKSELSLLSEVNMKNTEDRFMDAFDSLKPSFLLGIVYKRPLEKIKSKEEIKTTQLKIEALEKEKDEIILNLESQLSKMHIQIKNYENILELNKQQIDSSKERTREELKYYHQGRGDLTYVIESRDNEQNAKLTYAFNALNYQNLVLNYSELIDTIYEEGL